MGTRSGPLFASSEPSYQTTGRERQNRSGGVPLV
jgi:hypothetical protein